MDLIRIIAEAKDALADHAGYNLSPQGTRSLNCLGDRASRHARSDHLISICTYLDAFKAAAHANATHGVPIRNADKRHRVEVALTHPQPEKTHKRKSNPHCADLKKPSPVKSFAKDSASKIGVSEDTIERDVRIAEKLTSEVREAITIDGSSKTTHKRNSRARKVLLNSDSPTNLNSFTKDTANKTGVTPKTVREERPHHPTNRLDPHPSGVTPMREFDSALISAWLGPGPWLIHPSGLAQIQGLARSGPLRLGPDPSDPPIPRDVFDHPWPGYRVGKDGIAHIAVQGPLLAQDTPEGSPSKP